MQTSEMPDLLTVPEVAEVLRIGRNEAYEAVRRGDIPSIRIGRSIRVPSHRLMALLDGKPDPASATKG